jgi:hypothetical protein
MLSQHVIVTENDCRTWNVCEKLSVDEDTGDLELRKLWITNNLLIARHLAAILNSNEPSIMPGTKRIWAMTYLPDGVAPDLPPDSDSET